MAEKRFRIQIDPQSLVPGSAVRKYYLFSLFLIVVMGGVIGFLYNRLPNSVPLYMTQPWGEARLAHKLYIILLPLISLVVIVVNQLTSRAVNPNQRAVVTALALGAMMFSMMMSLALYGIVQSIL